MIFRSLKAFSFLTGQGDGQWKKVSRDELQRDMKLYRKMSGTSLTILINVIFFY